MQTLTLTAPAHAPRATSIVIGKDTLTALPKILKDLKADRVAVLFDAGIKTIADGIIKNLGPNVIPVAVASGDASKSLAEVEKIVKKLLDAGATRKTVFVCIGGGMLTDLGGFAASIFMRGVPCVLVPTTMLGAVDAAIGGKTAVNSGGRKNMIGTIAQPHAVVIDMKLLLALPEAQLKEGLVEVIKIAAIVDLPFFEWLEDNIMAVLKRDDEACFECVSRAVEAKVKIVEADEHDREERLLLNFGHTVGHAVEALSNYEMAHGTAVGIGMRAEMALAKFKDARRVSALLDLLGLPSNIPASMKPAALWQAMQSDKKNEGGEVRVAVPTHIGEGSVHAVTEKDFLKLFS